MAWRLTLLGLPRSPSRTLLAVSLAGWVLLQLLGHGTQSSAALCLSYSTSASAAHTAAATVLVEDNIMFALALWIVMVVAMMSPLLTQPIAQLRLRSLMHRRRRAVALFIAGYLAIWTIAGFALVTASEAIALLAASLGWSALAMAMAIAAIWQATPWRQSTLNRCHLPPNLSAFGLTAELDCLRFGATHGTWCAAACAPWMLLPLTTPAFHLPLMLVISAAMTLERMGPARPTAWTWRILPGEKVAGVLLRSQRRSVR
jgi:predicted metal-binding membrane protein